MDSNLQELSNILVSTIQEARDRISDIESIYSTQLYPKFQLMSQNLEKMYSEEDASKEKQKHLMLQIDKLLHEKEQILKEKDFLEQLKELQNELEQKTVEVNEVKEENKNLRKVLALKASVINSYIKTVKELEEQLFHRSDSFNHLVGFEKERTHLLDEQKVLVERIEKLQQSLFERTKESSEGLELHGKLLQQIGIKDSKLLSEKRKRKGVIAAYKRLKAQYSALCKRYDVNPDMTVEEHKTIRDIRTPTS